MNQMTSILAPSAAAQVMILNARDEFSDRNPVSNGAVELAEFLVEHAAEDRTNGLIMFLGGATSTRRMIADDIMPGEEWGEEMARITGGKVNAAMWRRAYSGEIARMVDVDVAPLAQDVPPACIRAIWAMGIQNHTQHSATGDVESDIRFLTLGLTGEAGELANFVKKRWRDGVEHGDNIRYEIADVCAYAFMLAATLGLRPEDLIATIELKQQIFVEKMTGLAASRGAGAGAGVRG